MARCIHMFVLILSFLLCFVYRGLLSFIYFVFFVFFYIAFFTTFTPQVTHYNFIKALYTTENYNNGVHQLKLPAVLSRLILDFPSTLDAFFPGHKCEPDLQFLYVPPGKFHDLCSAGWKHQQMSFELCL